VNTIQDVARHAELGHLRLAFVTASGTTMSRNEKIRGFRAAAEAAGLGASAKVIAARTQSEYGDSEMVDLGREQGRRMATRRDRPTGLVAVNDLLAFGLLAGLRDAPHAAVPGRSRALRAQADRGRRKR